MRHRPIQRHIRELVYAKYDGHCAYCGCELEYKDMQVDHIESLYKKSVERDIFLDDPELNQDDSLDNLMPSCRQCNYYKSTGDIESLRRMVKGTLEHTCIGTFVAKLAIKYGILTFKPWDGKFFFERYEKKLQ